MHERTATFGSHLSAGICCFNVQPPNQKFALRVAITLVQGSSRNSQKIVIADPPEVGVIQSGFFDRKILSRIPEPYSTALLGQHERDRVDQVYGLLLGLSYSAGDDNVQHSSCHHIRCL